MRSRAYLLASWLIGSFGLGTGTARATLQVASSPAGEPTAGPSAEELFTRAARVQAGQLSVDEPEVSLHVRMMIELQDDKGTLIQLHVERKFLPPAFLWTRIQDGMSRNDVITGFDGEQGWTRSGDTTTLLDGPEFAEDRRQLDHDIEETRLFSRLFFLGKLRPLIAELKRLPDEEGFGHRAYVLSCRGTFSPPQSESDEPVELTLWIDQETAYLMGARVRYLDSNRPTLQLCFTQHRAEKESGVIIPGKIELYYGDQKQPASTIYPGSIQFGAPLTRKDFLTQR